jgi:hypothetical protein
MSIEQEVYGIMGEKLVTNYDHKKIIAWAYQLIVKGYQSENLLILAGLGNESSDVIDIYFKKTIEDLKISTDKSDKELIEIFALQLINEVVEEKIDPRDGLSLMQEIVIATDYSDRFIQFYALQEDLDFYNNLDDTVHNPEIDASKIEKSIIEEFKRFIEQENQK